LSYAITCARLARERALRPEGFGSDAFAVAAFGLLGHHLA
jgi:hypothetical protein